MPDAGQTISLADIRDTIKILKEHDAPASSGSYWVPVAPTTYAEFLALYPHCRHCGNDREQKKVVMRSGYQTCFACYKKIKQDYEAYVVKWKLEDSA